MNTLKNVSETASDVFESVTSNKTVTGILSTLLSLFLILYASLAAPKLPRSVGRVFNNIWIKLVFMFLIAYIACKDISIAIISSIALLITLQTISAQNTSDAVMNEVNDKVKKAKEDFTNKNDSDEDEDEDDENENENNSDVETQPEHLMTQYPDHLMTPHAENLLLESNVQNEIVGHDTTSFAELASHVDGSVVSVEQVHATQEQEPVQVVKSSCDNTTNLDGYDGLELANF